MKTNNSKKAVIYCRVSTREQVDEGNSLVTQEKMCRDYALAHGFTIAEVFIERGESAKTTNRPQLTKLMSYCSTKKNNISFVIAYKIDRISRNSDDYSQIRLLLKRYQVEIKSTSETFENTPAGRFMENIIVNVGQFDNDVRTERCVGGMRQAVLEGRYVWNAPLGYSNMKINGKSNIVPNKYAELIKLGFNRIAENTSSTSDVFKTLTNMGLVTSSGKPYSKSQFYKTLKNEVYCGWIQKLGERVKGLYEPLVTEELFDQVQRVITGRSHKRCKYLTNNPAFPLRKFVLHPEGKKITGYWAQGQNKKYPYYRFIGISKSDIRKDILESEFVTYLDQFKLSTDDIKQFKKCVVDRFDNINRQKLNDRSKLVRSIQDLKEKQTTIINKNIEGVISNELLKSQLKIIEDQLTYLSSQLYMIPTREESMKAVFNLVKIYLANPGQFWLNATLETQIRLQWFEFPIGLIYSDGKFRTPEIVNENKKKTRSIDYKSPIVDFKRLYSNKKSNSLLNDAVERTYRLKQILDDS